jgi:hypothetical protein
MSDFNFDYLGYNQGKRKATTQYGASSAKNAYAQFLSQQRGSRKKFDLEQGYERQAPRVVSRFTQRGLAGPGVRSGVYNRGLQDFSTQNLQDLNRLSEDQTAEMQGLELDQRQSTADFNDQIAGLEAAKAAQIANAAATLSAFKPFLGGS